MARIPAACVHFLGGDAYVRTESDSFGALQEDGPVVLVKDYRSHCEEFGKAIIDALGRSRRGAPRAADLGPEAERDLLRPYLELSGVQTWLKFSKLSTMLSLYTDRNELVAMLWGPAERGGGRGAMGGADVSISPEERRKRLPDWSSV